MEHGGAFLPPDAEADLRRETSRRSSSLPLPRTRTGLPFRHDACLPRGDAAEAWAPARNRGTLCPIIWKVACSKYATVASSARAG